MAGQDREEAMLPPCIPNRNTLMQTRILRSLRSPHKPSIHSCYMQGRHSPELSPPTRKLTDCSSQQTHVGDSCEIVPYEHRLVLPQFTHLLRLPFGTMSIPHVGQEDVSPAVAGRSPTSSD